MKNSSSFAFFMSDIWPVVLEECKKHMATEATYNIWIDPLVPTGFDNNSVTLSTNSFAKKIIEEKFLPVLSDSFKNVLGFSININIVTPDSPETQPEDEEDRDDDDEEASFLSAAEQGIDFGTTFDSFIVAPSNRLPYTAALAVAKNPGRVHNPLYIYGNSGLGKTHLLKAVQSELIARRPSINILYTNGENFINEIIAHLAERNMNDFHEKYRNLDVLLMDDIQILSGKNQMQEEFFYTFEALISNGKQIVVTSDRPPKDIEVLSERLRSRFEQGLLTDIQPPDLETRIAIVKRKSELLGMVLPDDVMEFIAEKLKTNIRQLEGAVKKIHAIRTIDSSIPPIVLANDAIKDILTYNKPVSVTINIIIDCVAKTFGVSAEDIRGDKKKAQISNARQVAMYIIRELTDLSLEAIGEEFNGKNHSTVIYSTTAIEKKIVTNPSLKATIADIIKNVQEN